MSVEELNPRVDKLEWRMDAHEEHLKHLSEQTRGLKKELTNINKALLQIKWIAVGGVIAVLGQTMGVGSFFKLLGV